MRRTSSNNNRRMTLGPVSDTRVNSKKKTTRNSAGPGGGHRRRKSLIPSDLTSRKSTSRSSHQSRSSRGRRQSSIYGGSVGTVDPRPINDPGYMNTEQRVLIGYLVEKNYDHQISPRTLTNPTGKDFENIANFLFRQIDPTFKFHKSMVNEVPLMFKGLHYPFNISKTALSAVGSPHTWPYLLACLTWLIELLGYDEDAEKAKVENRQSEAAGTGEGGKDGDLVFFEYLHEAYGSFLAGDDEHYQNLESDLEGRVTEQNEVFSEEIEKLKDANALLKKELNVLQSSGSTLPKLKSKRADLQGELQNVKDALSQQEDARKDQKETLRHRRMDLGMQEKELANAEAEAQKLKEKISSQSISAADVEEMTKRRLKLKDQMTQQEEQLEEKRSAILNVEDHIADGLKALNEFVDKYNEKAAELKMIPSTAKNADGEDLKLVVNGRTSDVVNVNPKRVIKPAVRRMEDNYNIKTTEEKTRTMSLESSIKSVESLKREREEQLIILKNECIKTEEQLKREKAAMELCVQKGAEETEEYELRIHKLRHEPNAHTERLQIDLQEAKSNFEQTKASIEQQRGRLASQFEKSLNSITNHKFHFESKLNEALKEIKGKRRALQSSGM